MQMKVRKNEYKSHISLFPMHRKKILLQTWATVLACKQGRISTAQTELSCALNPSLSCKQDQPNSKEWASPKAAQLPPLLPVTEVSKDFSPAAAEVLIPHGPAWHRK